MNEVKLSPALRQRLLALPVLQQQRVGFVLRVLGQEGISGYELDLAAELAITGAEYSVVRQAAGAICNRWVQSPQGSNEQSWMN